MFFSLRFGERSFFTVYKKHSTDSTIDISGYLVDLLLTDRNQICEPICHTLYQQQSISTAAVSPSSESTSFLKLSSISIYFSTTNELCCPVFFFPNGSNNPHLIPYYRHLHRRPLQDGPQSFSDIITLLNHYHTFFHNLSSQMPIRLGVVFECITHADSNVERLSETQ